MGLIICVIGGGVDVEDMGIKDVKGGGLDRTGMCWVSSLTLCVCSTLPVTDSHSGLLAFIQLAVSFKHGNAGQE